jgi:hypothetical protein
MVQWDVTITTTGLATNEPLHLAPGDSVRFTVGPPTPEGDIAYAFVDLQPAALQQQSAWDFFSAQSQWIEETKSVEFYAAGAQFALRSVPDTLRITMRVDIVRPLGDPAGSYVASIDVVQCPCLDKGCAITGQPFPIRASHLPSAQGNSVAITATDAVQFKQLVCSPGPCPCPAYCLDKSSPSAFVDLAREARASAALKIAQQPYGRR